MTFTESTGISHEHEVLCAREPTSIIGAQDALIITFSKEIKKLRRSL